MTIEPGFKGNKRALPSKPCVQCGRAMAWRRAWAKNWAEVKYCSDRCRADAKRGAARALGAGSARGAPDPAAAGNTRDTTT